MDVLANIQTNDLPGLRGCDTAATNICSDRTDVASICDNGEMNSLGDGQFNEFLSNSITTNVEITASVPQVQLCDEETAYCDSPLCDMETAHCDSPNFNNALLSCHNNATVLYNIDRFNYCFFDTLNNADCYYVYIHNFRQSKPGGFYYLRFCCTSGRITVHACDSYPIGALWVCDTIKLCIYPMFSDLQYCQMK